MEHNLGRHLIANYVSLAIMGVSGILINFLLAMVQGASAQGVFNQIYAVFIILSQVSCGAMHHSAQKHIADNLTHPEFHGTIAATALAGAALSGFIVSLALYVTAPAVGSMLGSPDVSEGLRMSAPGLFLLTLNKVLLGVLNGKRLMDDFAVLQALRSILLAAAVAVFAITDSTYGLYGASFSIAEGIVFLGAVAVVLRHTRASREGDRWGWLRRHALFGAKGIVTGVLTEANIRIDIIVIGIFMDDAAVGIYSLAGTVAEAYYNLFHVIRVNVNPILASNFASREHEYLQALIRKTQLLTVPAAISVAATTLVGFYLFIHIFVPNSNYYYAIVPLGILLGALSLYSAFLPFDFILLQAGYPGRQSLFYAAQTAINLALNFTLVPSHGLVGAAAATASAYLASIPILIFFARRYTGLLLLPVR